MKPPMVRRVYKSGFWRGWFVCEVRLWLGESIKVVFGEGGVVNEIDLMTTTTHGYDFHHSFEFKMVM